MKLGICAFPLSRGKETGRGLEKVTQEFVDYLSGNNLDFEFSDSGIIRSEFRAFFSSLTYFFRLHKIQADCFFAFYPVAGFFPIFLRKKPVVLGVYDLIPFHVFGFDSRLKYAIKRFCIRYSCKRSEAIIVPFQTTKNEIVELFNVDPNKITVIPHGVNLQTYFPDPDIIKTHNQVAYLGEAKRAKGMDSIIRAFALVLDKRPTAKLKLASHGNELSEMKALAAQLLPRESYDFVGFVPEKKMRKFYTQADVFVFPSRYGFGLSSLEAMACGTPTIVGATLDAKEFLTDIDLIVDPDRVEDLATKILKLLEDQKMYERKSAEAIRMAKQFQWDKVCERYYNVCLDVISKYESKNG